MTDYSKDLVDALKSIVFDCNWQDVGHVDAFRKSKCYRLYNLDEISEDILLIRHKDDKFYAMDARCSHEGGPLDEGDIEELGEKVYVICPWHSFDFELTTGVSSTGLKQETFEVKIVNQHVYINTPNKLTLNREDLKSLNAPNSQPQDEAKQAGTEEPNDSAKESTLTYWAAKILNTPDPKEKANLTFTVAEKWKNGELDVLGATQPPDQPKRLETLNVIDPAKIRRGKGGTQASRIALLHSLANIEQWAIDLSWDIICRYASLVFPDGSSLPKEFFSDFIKVACDEAKHFNLLDKRLVELDSYFGSLPVHNGLWESATVTKDNFLSRLAIVHMVHEARGLDVHPQTRLRFANQKDTESVKLLDILYEDEITHVAAGIKWFQYSCTKYDHSFIETFHSLVKQFFKGYLKPPFNTEGRTSAGMSLEWYMPLIRTDEGFKTSD